MWVSIILAFGLLKSQLVEFLESVVVGYNISNTKYI